jgi:hypothetical protein
MIEAEQVTHWVEQAREQLDLTRERASEWDVKVRKFAQEQPLTALLVAATGGYVLARLSTMRFR